MKLKACKIVNEYIQANFPEWPVIYHPEQFELYPFLSAIEQFLIKLGEDVNEMGLEEIREEYGSRSKGPYDSILEEFLKTGDMGVASERLLAMASAKPNLEDILKRMRG